MTAEACMGMATTRLHLHEFDWGDDSPGVGDGPIGMPPCLTGGAFFMRNLAPSLRGKDGHSATANHKNDICPN